MPETSLPLLYHGPTPTAMKDLDLSDLWIASSWYACENACIYRIFLFFFLRGKEKHDSQSRATTFRSTFSDNYQIGIIYDLVRKYRLHGSYL